MTDTLAKRASCLGLALSFTMHLPIADGTIAAADRLHLAHLYSGIAASDAASNEITAVAAPSAATITALSPVAAQITSVAVGSGTITGV